MPLLKVQCVSFDFSISLFAAFAFNIITGGVRFILSFVPYLSTLLFKISLRFFSFKLVKCFYYILAFYWLFVCMIFFLFFW